MIREALLLVTAIISTALPGPSEAAQRWEKKVRNGETFLIGADFRELDLSDASLARTKLLAANFENATLLGVDFTGADLRGAKGLTLEQLQTVKTLYQAQLDPQLESALKSCCAWLFQKF